MSSLFRRDVLYSQNFLHSTRLVDQLLARSSLGAADVVYEIGPGSGVITDRLGQHCQRVVAIEKDPDLAARLRGMYAASPRIVIQEGDFLRVRLPSTRYKVFANIPFNITTAIMTKLTTAPCPPDDAYLVMQREAAGKFLGRPRESLYAVLLKPWFEPAIVHSFKRTDFIPVPQVDIVMLRLRKRGPPLVDPADARMFRDFVTYGFTAWQPALWSPFPHVFTSQQFRRISSSIGLQSPATPTSIEFQQWLDLFHFFQTMCNARARQTVIGSEVRLRLQQAGLQKMHRTVPRIAGASASHRAAT